MAFDWSKLNFFSRLDARARVLVLFGGIVGILLLVYLLTRWISGSEAAVGPSRVASAPQGLQSVQGGELTPEYRQALMQANTQNQQQAQMTGGSAIPTLTYMGGPTSSGSAQCTLCSDQAPNIKYLMDEWVKQGRMSPETSSNLQDLADKNIWPDQFASSISQLIAAGTLAPEQARQLLDIYKKQYDFAKLQESAKFMDPLIKNGSLPVDVASALLDMQRIKVRPSDYGLSIQKFVKDSRITPAIGQQLLAQYTQQRAKQIVAQSLAVLHNMQLNGEITPEIEKGVSELENQLVPVDSFVSSMQNYLKQNKITPAVADKIIDEYKWQKAQIGASGLIERIVQRAIDAAYKELTDLLATSSITPDVASLIKDMIQRNVAFTDFQDAINNLVAQKKLNPEISKLKLADYLRIVQTRTLAQRLSTLQANNASLSDYSDELKRAVAAGLITPDEAAQLMREYQAMTGQVETPTVAAANTTASFAQLQQRVQQSEPANQAIPSSEQFQVPPQPAATPQTVAPGPVVSPDRQSKIMAMMQAMSNQSQQLVSAWQPPAMIHKEGVPPPTPSTDSGTGTSGSGTGTNADGTSATNPAGIGGPVLIKAGTIYFAVLETTANSDYPDAPVMATIVSGPFKGAKLLGKLQTSKNVAGQLDRITLNFTMMSVESWPSTRSITAYAVDPDTAKTALATQVNNHYFLRYGSIMASSFLQGFATAITTSGSSQVNGALGTTTTTHPNLGVSDKIYVGLGQIGQTIGGAAQNWINIPPTVKVDSGVGLGILFMTDVS